MSKLDAMHYRSFDDKIIHTRYIRTDNARAVLLIAHGLGEHAWYYEAFAEAASQLGFDVYINDARGHGDTGGYINNQETDVRIGDTGENAIESMVKDLHVLTLLIRSSSEDIPIFLLGHSMGAVVSALFAESYGHLLSGIILSGLPSAERYHALLESIDHETKRFGPQAVCRETFQKLFEGINTPFEPVKTALDWITGDDTRIAEILTLPATFVLYSNGFYNSFLRAGIRTQNLKGLTNGDKTKPILLLSGEQDTLTQNGAYTKRLSECLKDAGFSSVDCIVYRGLRHSILQETQRTAVGSDIADWIINNLHHKY